MGRRGPSPKPTALKVLAGNPGKRPLNKTEPQPRKASKYRCPDWMPETGKQEWARVVPELQSLGLLTVVDQSALEIYCKAYATWRSAEAWIDEYGNVLEIRDKETGKITYKPVPYVAIAKNASETVRRFCQEFGLTPAARSRLQTPDRVIDPDDLDRFFS